MQKMTSEERQIVECYIYAEWARRVLERDLKIIQVANVRYPDVYVSVLEQAIMKLSQDMRDINKYIYREGIKVYDSGITQRESIKVFNYMVSFRGYQEKLNIIEDVMRNKVRQCIEKIFGELGEK